MPEQSNDVHNELAAVTAQNASTRKLSGFVVALHA